MLSSSPYYDRRHAKGQIMVDQVRNEARALGIGWNHIRNSPKYVSRCFSVMFRDDQDNLYDLQDHDWMLTAHCWPADGGDAIMSRHLGAEYNAAALVLRDLVGKVRPNVTASGL